MGYNAILSSEVDVGSPGKAELFQKIKDNFDYLYTMIGGPVEVPNGSFEIDTDNDGIPDNWTLNLYAGGSAAFDTASAHGSKAYKFTRTAGAGNGGGYLESGYMECSPIGVYMIGFSIKSSVANLKNIVKIRYFNKDKVYISDQDVYSSTTNPTSWQRYQYTMNIPSDARYYKIRLIGGYTDTDVAGDTYYDDVAIYNKVVNQSQLKTATGIVGGYTGHYIIPGGEYAFMPAFAVNNISEISAKFCNGAVVYPNNWYAFIYLHLIPEYYNTFIYAKFRYVTSSGTEYWIFVLYDKQQHKILASYDAPDHPCYGNGGDENKVPHPFMDYLGNPLPDNIEIVLLDMVTTNELRRRSQEEGRVISMLLAEYDVDMSKEIEFVPRDMDGKRTLTQKHPSYKVRRLLKKEV